VPDASYLEWPFFSERHRTLARDLNAWMATAIEPLAHAASDDAADVDAACRRFVRALGTGGWLRHVVPATYGGLFETLDVRALCLVREHLARVSGLADFAFAMQGLGSGPITLFGSDALKRRYLPRVCAGDAIAAFAMSEAGAGSDVAAMRTTARRDGSSWRIDGEKTWISNAGIADHYIVFARTPDLGERAFGAFVVDADASGLAVRERIDVIAPHPLGTIAFDGCRVPNEAMVGEPGKGMSVALGTLDVFRPTVAAAALGFARRALDEAVSFVRERDIMGRKLSEYQLTQAKLADMMTAIDASALLVYRAAWTRDNGAPRITREAAMAKMFSTEAAQRVIDDAVQLLGGRGVVRGAPVERLYREIRALRIYEGTTEVQKIVLAGQLLSERHEGTSDA
jgi:acyl-CoA dehydrogenase